MQLCIQCALPVATIMALWQLLNLGTGCTVYIYPINVINLWAKDCHPVNAKLVNPRRWCPTKLASRQNRPRSLVLFAEGRGFLVAPGWFWSYCHWNRASEDLAVAFTSAWTTTASLQTCLTVPWARVSSVTGNLPCQSVNAQAPGTSSLFRRHGKNNKLIFFYWHGRCT